jgi:Protein of unknown function (DUF2851)
VARRTTTRDAPLAMPAREAEVAARWAAGVWRGATLQALSGANYRLIFEGRRNGGPGPDFRDAALEREDGARLLGDIELHLRARDWLAHGHHTDPRYNRVILHVALDAAFSFSPLASGGDAPIACLSFTSAPGQTAPDWPCANLHAPSGSMVMPTLLLWAGAERFERRVRAFANAVSRASPALDTCAANWTSADHVLWVALAEALGYGQHREALRQAGMRLLAGESPALEQASRSERRRLVGLLALWDRWRATGPWEPFARRARGGTGGDRHYAACLGRRRFCVAGAHYGGECRLSLRSGARNPERRRCAGCMRPRGVSRIAWAAVEPGHSGDDAATSPRQGPHRGGGAARAAPSLGGLVPGERLRALPLQSS